MNDALSKSQQGLYCHGEAGVGGVFYLRLKEEFKSSKTVQRAMVMFCKAVYRMEFAHKWVVGFSYNFSQTATQYLSGIDTEDLRKYELDKGIMYGNQQHFKNSNYHAILLSNPVDLESYLEQREMLRDMFAAENLKDKVDIFEVLGMNRPDAKVLGGRFVHGVHNPNNLVSLERHVVVPGGDTLTGSTFLFTQVFDFERNALEKLSNLEMERMIGINVEHQRVLLCPDQPVSHIQRMRAVPKSLGTSVELLRIPMIPLTKPRSLCVPTGLVSIDEARKIYTLSLDQSSFSVEQGMFFAGCSRRPERLKILLGLMSGNESDQFCTSDYNAADKLLSFVSGVTGGYFWVPPVSALIEPSGIWPNTSAIVLPEILDIERRNKYMFLNCQQWLHAMSSGKYAEPSDIPSARILQLASATFEHWKARETKIPSVVELPHLEQVLIDDPSKLPEDFTDHNGNRPDLEKAKTERENKYNDPRFSIPPLGHYIKDVPIIMRKGLAIREQLSLLTETNPDARTRDIQGQLDSLRIDPREIIVGTLEEYSLVSGKLAMEYLCYGDERDEAKAATLSESSAMGHIVPDYGIILEKGLAVLMKEVDEKIKGAPKPHSNQKVHFWKGAKYALQGIDVYLENFAKLAERKREELKVIRRSDFNNGTTETETASAASLLKSILPLRSHSLESNTLPKADACKELANLADIEKTLQMLRKSPPVTLIEAVQLFYVTHASLHWTCDPVSAGRLDQILKKYYDMDLERVSHLPQSFNHVAQDLDVAAASALYHSSAQEIIDALCLKWDEKVKLSTTTIPDATAFGGCTAVAFSTGPFPTGDSNNQWFQQVNLGGMKANAHEFGTDGCNDVTMLFLKSMRRLPLNAPCVSLRLNEQTPPEILEEAAKCLLSGGAHPVIFHDRNVSKGLLESLSAAYKEEQKSDHYSSERLLSMSRQFSCDGCYEPLLMGYSDFTFLFVPLLQALECTLNRGAIFKDAGPAYLRGQIVNWSSPPVDEIESFDHLLDLTIDFHLDRQLKEFFAIPLAKFGALSEFCPSPLLSCLMHGAIERGRDLTQGGAMVHIVTPMLLGLSNFIDSLFAIKVMVYNPKMRVTTLPELARALSSNWGEKSIGLVAHRYQHLRRLALSLPKFAGPDYIHRETTHWISSRGNAVQELRDDVSNFGKEIAKRLIDKAKAIAEVAYNKDNLKPLQERYSDVGFPFQFTVCVGCGTFENYVGCALILGASADGRLAGHPVASDCSPAPSPVDLPPLGVSTSSSQYKDIVDALKAYDDEAFRTGFANACEIDVKIEERTKLDDIRAFLQNYANDEVRAASVLTFTVGDPDRYVAAVSQPDLYNLFRVRMGGWTNFFVSLFPLHQKQHERRPFYKIERQRRSITFLASEQSTIKEQ